MYCPDAYDRYRQHEAEQESWLSSRPVCGECKERIQDETCYEISGQITCDYCMEGHKVWTEDLMA